MIQLHPKETFTIVRQIEDHTDSGTYYVQAVIRNSKTDALLATVNLDNKGNRRFTKSYIVPADPSGEGMWISILTSVYTDSGYTTKSQSYADKMESYLVQARPVFNPNYPIPTGQDIDYKKIRTIIESVVNQNKPEPFKVTEFETYVGALRKDIKEVVSLLNKIPTDTVELSPILDNNDKNSKELKSLIGKINIPTIDYDQIKEMVVDELNSFKEKISSIISATKGSVNMSESQKSELMKAISDSFSENTEKYKKAEMIESKLDEIVNIVGYQTEDKVKPKEDMKTKRITRLMQRL